MDAAAVVASLRCLAIEVDLGEFTYEIDPLPAADWIAAVLTGESTDIFPGLLRDAELESQVWLALVDGAAVGDDVLAASRHALEAAAGRSWWEAERLIVTVGDEQLKGLVLGRLVRDGFDFESRPLGAFCDAVYCLVTEGLDKDKREEFNIKLRMPPAGVDIDDLYDEDEATAEFMAAMSGGAPG